MFRSVLIFLTAMAVPLPIFLELSSGKALWNTENGIEFIPNLGFVLNCGGYTERFDGLPIGFFSVLIYAFCFLRFDLEQVKLGLSRFLVTAVPAIFFFCIFILFLDLSVIRAASLVHVFPLIFIFSLAIQQPERASVKFFFLGYFTGIAVLGLATFLSHRLEGFFLENESHCMKYIFGVEIYQSLSSYPSVLFMLIWYLLFLCIYWTQNEGRITPKIIGSISLVTIFLSVLAAFSKRSSFIDLFMMFAVIAATWFFSLMRKPKAVVQVICAFSLLFLFAAQAVIYEKRQLNQVSSYTDRIETLEFLHEKPVASLDAGIMPHRSLEEKWGGRSSMLLEFAFRFSPVVGFPLFLLFLMSILSGLFLVAFPKVLSQGWRGFRFGGKRSVLTGIWLIPLMSSLVSQNVFNMHAQVPYFTSNLLAVIFLFRYQLDLNDD